MKNIDISNWVRYSVGFKVLIIVVLALLLLIPVSMVKGIIHERQSTKLMAVSEISQKWGNKQTLVGPVLSIPYKKYSLNKKGEEIGITKYIHVLPESLSINGNVESEIRSRGIFDAVVYKSNLNFSGDFSRIDLSSIDVKEKDILWDDAFVSVGVSDVRGIKDNIRLNWNEDIFLFKPGVKVDDVILKNPGFNNYNLDPYAGNKIFSYQENRAFSGGVSMSGSGVSVGVPFDKNEGYNFSFNLSINGSQDLQFVPLGKETNINIRSDWGSPSFRGAFLPDSRNVSESGFNASWKIFDLNRGYPQVWLGSAYNVYMSALGVNFLVEVDDYKKAERSVKYAILIIFLTFLVFFFVEILNRRKIHPIQYILVGFAIVLFYSLLVSISELSNFTFAYVVSGLATILLITLYSKNIFKSLRTALVQAFILLFLYVFVFITLQLEYYAFFIGSLLLFVVLSFVMYLSRKIDWYNVGDIEIGKEKSKQ